MPRRGFLGFVIAVSVLSAAQAAVFLVEVDQEHDDQGGATALSGALDLAVSPDGKNVYVPGSLDDGLVVFTRNTTNGTLSFLEEHIDGQGGIDGLQSVRGVAASPDGKHVYTAALLDSAVMGFSRNAGSGALTKIETLFDDGKPGGTIAGLSGATHLKVSQDGANVYVVARSDDAVVVFSRNSTSGALTYRQTVLNTSAGLGLDGVEWVDISPNDQFVYTAAENSHSVCAFGRTGVNGELTFRQVLFDGVSGADGLNKAVSVTVSPDGAHLYTACATSADGDDSLGVYSIHSTSGTLSFVEAKPFIRPPHCFFGVSGDSSVLFQPGAEHLLFALLSWGDGVFVHRRHPASGVLTLEQAKCDGLLAGYFGLEVGAFSPDGEYLYAVNITGDIAAFKVGPPEAAYVSSAAPLSGGRSAYTLVGAPGATYVMECTTNLAAGSEWKAVFTNTAGADALFGYTNAPDAAPARFYRSVVP